jgi:hypothetical protein
MQRVCAASKRCQPIHFKSVMQSEDVSSKRKSEDGIFHAKSIFATFISPQRIIIGLYRRPMRQKQILNSTRSSFGRNSSETERRG